MNALHVLFTTNRFNLSQVKEHFLNSRSFGEDVALWLRHRLIANGFQALEARQEDWGWQFSATNGSDRYWIGVGGNSANLEQYLDEGEWRIIILRRRSATEILLGRGKIADDDKMADAIEQILRADAAIRNIHRESDLEATRAGTGSSKQ